MVVWLVARPQNAVLALAATLLLPVLQILSGIIMVLLVLHQGVRVGVLEGLGAGALLALVALIVGAPIPEIVVTVLITWLPAILLASVLRATRSLTLTLQASVIVAVLIVTVFHVMVGDPLAYWQTMLTAMAEISKEMGLREQADILMSEQASVAGQMTMLVVFSSWTLYSASFLLGYLLYRQLPGDREEFGRFCDLSFGRVIALAMALASVLALASSAIWAQNIAILLFAVFWLQGLALVHWMYTDRNMPLFGVVAVYALMPVLHVMLVMALAVLGYTDVWFRYRRIRQAK